MSYLYGISALTGAFCFVYYASGSLLLSLGITLFVLGFFGLLSLEDAKKIAKRK